MKALIVVDVQRDFCAGGSLAVPDADRYITDINHEMRKPEYDVIVLTQDWHPRDHLSFAKEWGAAPFMTKEMSYGTQVLWPSHCMVNSQGAEFHPLLHAGRAAAVFRKGMDRNFDSYSAFEDAGGRKTGLHGYLDALEIFDVTVVGIALDFCVSATAISARKLGFGATVKQSLCPRIDRDGSLEAALYNMRREGVRVE